ncbi:MAG: hypothetical protein WKF81_13400 [Thermomicrobiales bacterium]
MTNQSNPATDTRQPGTVRVSSPDLFFGMRIRTVLKQLGYTVVLTKSSTEFSDHPDGIVLGLIDFNQPVNWLEFQPAIDGGLPIVAFGAHTNVAGFRAAKAAGVARVVSNGEFNRSLPDLAAKYSRK